MFLSTLLINVGTNPDRPRPGRLWLRNRYHVHQRLCMAFPPYNPDDFGQKQVHIERDYKSGFLFRIDPQPGDGVVIRVQSADKPDWDYAFHNADYLLVPPLKVDEYNPSFIKGQHFRFILVANPTKRLTKQSLHPKGGLVKEKWVGKRVPVPPDELIDWLARKAKGFSLDKGSTKTFKSFVYVKKPQADKGQRLFSVRYDGILEITDPVSFQQTLISGIGSAKAFGFGLLSVAKV